MQPPSASPPSSPSSSPSSAPSFRALGPDDVDALQDLLESVPSYAERITGYPPGPADGLSALVSVPDGFDPAGKYGLGLWDDEVLVAFADVLVGYPHPSSAFVGLLVVRGDRQGSGLGRTMHDAVVGWLRGPGAALAEPVGASAVVRLRLGIVATNADVAEPFWRALGYAPTGETKPYRYDHLVSTVALWERRICRTGTVDGSPGPAGHVERDHPCASVRASP